MPRADDIPSASVGLAAGLCLIALFLGLREWYERQAREPDLSPADDLHFSHQDMRRRLDVGVLLTIAVPTLAGSRIEPRAAGGANVPFVALWFLVLTLIMVLLGLALADLLATRCLRTRVPQGDAPRKGDAPRIDRAHSPAGPTSLCLFPRRG